MPLNSSQLAELVNRARHKAVTSPPSPPSPAAPRPVRSRLAAPVSQAPSTARIEPRTGALTLQPNDAVASPALSLPPSLAPSPQSEHAAEAFPIGWVLGKDFLALPSQVLRHLQATNGVRRIRLPAQAEPLRPGRAPRRGLLARHAAGKQQNTARPCRSMAADHHPAQGLAAANIGRIGGCRRRGRKSVPTRLSRAPSTLRTGSPCPV